VAAISITASSVLASTSARKDTYISAAAISAGQAVYLLADGTVGLADADGASPLYTVLGIAANSAPAAGQPVEVATYDSQFGIGGTIANGVPVFLSATAGGITSTAADNTTGIKTAFIGIGVGSNKILLSPVSGNTAI
jgi:hypothetical protein